ncbi:hypothetical protein KIM372_01320 [Bombiscardovia nodaiensis]|uniref:Uncharacterized protein n=1 Tax=Bombiscardovia nodaiensis TaxID=2932181 RepID=A0ABM8B5W9_9BIFI|nr:hypothetical protein KIM372_01320 [Bombiscardovia nodaiensis]
MTMRRFRTVSMLAVLLSITVLGGGSANLAAPALAHAESEPTSSAPANNQSQPHQHTQQDSLTTETSPSSQSQQSSPTAEVPQSSLASAAPKAENSPNPQHSTPSNDESKHAVPTPQAKQDPTPKLTPLGGGAQPYSCVIGASTFTQCFPDPQVASAVASNRYKTPSDTITNADITSITLIDISARGTVSLEGCQQLTELQSITLSGNFASVDLTPLSTLSKLRYLRVVCGLTTMTALAGLTTITQIDTLDLSNNQLTGIGAFTWSSLPNLKILRLEGNQIADASPLVDMPALTNLGLRNNKLTRLGTLRGLVNLTGSDPNDYGLDLAENQLTDLSTVNWAQFTKLKNLYLDHNQISDTSPLVNMGALTVLRLNNNAITYLGTLRGLVSLTTGQFDPGLDLSNNQISDISTVNWSQFSALKDLYLDHNQISDTSPLVNMGALTVLRLNNNAITYLGTLRGLVSLDTDPGRGRSPGPGLDLSNNQISDISTVNWSQFTKLPGILINNNLLEDMSPIHDMPALGGIYASHNKLTQLGDYRNLPKLTYVDLSYSEMTSTSLTTVPWPTLTKLDTLRIDYNKITDISPLTGMPALTRLYAANNEISTLGPLANPNLRGDIGGYGAGLELQNNNLTNASLTSVNWSQLTKLQYLRLDNNKITSSTLLSDIPSLGYLDLSQNQITTLGALNSPNLVYLYLHNNQLTSSSLLSVNWSQYTKLKVLNLNNNQIGNISPLTNMGALTTLYLDNNKIAVLGTLAGNTNLETLYLSKNQITSASLPTVDWSQYTKLANLTLANNKIDRLDTINWNVLAPSIQSLYLSNNQIADISPIDWSKFTKLVPGYLYITGQQIRLPDLPNYSSAPLTLGPAIVSHTPDKYADSFHSANADGSRNEYSQPAGGTYNTSTGQFTWPRSYPGDHKYQFNSNNIGLPNAHGERVLFSGIISQLVKGSAVTFDPQGGTMHSDDVVPLNPPTPVSEPTPPPTYTGYKLVGWYTQPAGGSRWDFSQNVTTNMTLYARWAPDFNLPNAGAIPLQQWSGGGLLAASALSALAYAGYHLAKRRQTHGKHALQPVPAK